MEGSGETENPQSHAQISKDLLEKMTGSKVLNYRVEGGSKPGDNYMSVLYSVSAELLPPNQSTSETRHYLFKCHPEHPSRQDYLKETNMFHNELQYYNVWAKALVDFQKEILGNFSEKVTSPAFPICVGGKTIDFRSSPDSKSNTHSSLDNFIMMIDMKKSFGYKMVDRTTMLDLDHMTLVFKELAVLHSLSWVYKQKKDLNLLKRFPFLKSPFGSEDVELWTKICNGNVKIAVTTLDAALGNGNPLSESSRKFIDMMPKLVEFFLFQKIGMEEQILEMHRNPPKEYMDEKESDLPWRIIGHGDCWSNNLLFKYDSNGKPDHALLLDFQLSREACPTTDFVHVLYTSTNSKFRAAHLDTLFQIYHDKFLDICNVLGVEPLPGFSLRTIKRKFHCSKLIGYMMAMSMLPMKMNQDDQPINLEEVNKSAKLDDMFSEAFRTGSGGTLYQTCMLETAKELYDEGVI